MANGSGPGGIWRPRPLEPQSDVFCKQTQILLSQNTTEVCFHNQQAFSQNAQNQNVLGQPEERHPWTPGFRMCFFWGGGVTGIVKPRLAWVCQLVLVTGDGCGRHLCALSRGHTPFSPGNKFFRLMLQNVRAWSHRCEFACTPPKKKREFAKLTTHHQCGWA